MIDHVRFKSLRLAEEFITLCTVVLLLSGVNEQMSLQISLLVNDFAHCSHLWISFSSWASWVCLRRLPSLEKVLVHNSQGNSWAMFIFAFLSESIILIEHYIGQRKQCSDISDEFHFQGGKKHIFCKTITKLKAKICS